MGNHHLPTEQPSSPTHASETPQPPETTHPSNSLATISIKEALLQAYVYDSRIRDPS
jgi:hypothetical protein